MYISLIIARLIGPLFSVIGIAMLTNQDTYRRVGDQFLASYPVIYLSGLLVFLIGLTILNVHHVWARDWRSAITAIGWVLTCAGVFRILAPQFVVFVGSGILSHGGFFIGAGLVLLSLGGFLTYKGYVADAAGPSETHS